MSSDRIQREVEELLAQLDQFPPRRSLSSRIKDAIAAPFRFMRNGLAAIHLPALNAGHVLLIAIAMIVVAYLVGGSSDIWRWIIVAGIILFVGAFIFSLRRHSRPTEKYWRDRPMDLRKGSRSFWDRWRTRR
jgi:hypothetical protein